MSAEELFEKRFVHLVARVKAVRSSGVALAPWRKQAKDPEALLNRWLEGVTIASDTAIALSGVGDGSHIEALLERMPEDGMVFCSEKDVGRFRAFLGTERAGRLLSDKRVYFGVGELDDLFFRSLASFAVLDYTDAQPLVFAPHFQEDESYYSTFFLEFARQLEMWRKMYGTNLTQSGKWQRNTFTNLRRLAVSPDPIEFQAAFEGVPMIMAGAGPSLDESLDFIKSMEDRAVIVAGNSSIRALRRAGIDPHFVLAADPNETTDKGFEGVELGRSILVCPFMLYPGVVPRFGERVSAWAFGNETATYARRAGGKERFAFVSEQGTVSACAFDLAVILGCPAVFFAGQDLAARTDGKLHLSDSFYSDLGGDTANLSKCRWLPGNTIEKVPVEEKLFIYLKTFEELTRAYTTELKAQTGKGLSVYNLSRLGAKVKGMPYLPLEKAGAVLNSHRSGNVAKSWERAEGILQRQKADWTAIEPAFSQLRQFVEGLCRSALAQAISMEMGDVDLEKAEACRVDLEARIDENPMWEKILGDGVLKLELHSNRRATRILRRQGKSKRDGELCGYFWALSEGCYHLLVSLDEAGIADPQDVPLTPDS